MAASSIHPTMPRGALLGAAAVVGITLSLVTLARLSGLDATSRPVAAPVASRDLAFVDRADGAVVIRDVADHDRQLGLLAPGTNGFARGVLRGLARERHRNGLGDDTPFRLTRFANGDLWLTDLATNRQIYLAAFGPTNAGVFAELLDEKDRLP